MSLLQNFNNPILIANYNILSFIYWLRGKLELLLPNYKVKLLNICVKIWIKNIDQKYLDICASSSKIIYEITGIL